MRQVRIGDSSRLKRLLSSYVRQRTINETTGHHRQRAQKRCHRDRNAANLDSIGSLAPVPEKKPVVPMAIVEGMAICR